MVLDAGIAQRPAVPPARAGGLLWKRGLAPSEARCLYPSPTRGGGEYGFARAGPLPRLGNRPQPTNPLHGSVPVAKLICQDGRRAAGSGRSPATSSPRKPPGSDANGYPARNLGRLRPFKRTSWESDESRGCLEACWSWRAARRWRVVPAASRLSGDGSTNSIETATGNLHPRNCRRRRSSSGSISTATA